MKNGRFYAGLVGVAGIVTYLIWTGVSDTMVYYLTPTELAERIEADPTFADVGIKVSGRVVEGSWIQEGGSLKHSFTVEDLEDPNPAAAFTVQYNDILPDTFNDEAEVVVEGQFDEAGVFQAHTVLTKCGSRYEAAPEAMTT